MFEFRCGAAGAARKITSMTVTALALMGATAGVAQAAITDAVPAGCAAATVIPTNPTMRQAASDAVLCLINVERTLRGLAPVLTSSQLGKAATSHASDMVRRKYFSHVTPNGEDLRKRVARTGYLRGARRPALGETLAWGSDLYASPAELVKDLMQSPEHKAIIVDRRFRDIGVGLALGAPEDGMGSGSTLSLNFGRR
jgi:uncharacterized protein YkwD